MKRFLVVALASLVPVLVACGGGGGGGSVASSSAQNGSSSGAQQVTVKGMDTMKFDPATVSVKAGQPIQVTLDNTGQVLHDFTVEQAQGVPRRVQVAAQPGQKATSQPFTIATPGTYTFVCSQPGHAAAGMQGKLVVQ